MDIIEIEIRSKREGALTKCHVERLSDNEFRMSENDILNCTLTYGTEFKTRVNKDGEHEIVRITKESPFITRRFLLTSKFGEADYRLLGDEITNAGGFWQVDFGGLATINLPQQCDFDIDQLFVSFNFTPTEIKD